MVNTSNNSDCEAALEAVGTLYSAKKVTLVHGDIQESREEKIEVDQLLDKEKMKQEWHVLKDMI